MDTSLVYVAATLSIIALSLLVTKPLWGVMAIFIAKPVVDTTWATPVLLDFKLTEIVSAAVPLIVFARMFFDDESRRRVAAMPLKWIWLIWSVDVIGFSTFVMFSQGWTEGLQVVMRHLNGVAGFCMLQVFCRTDEDFRRVAWALVVAGLFPMATGAIEGITGVHWRVTLGPQGVIRNVGFYHDAITIRYYALQTIMALLLVVSLSKRSMLAVALSLMYGLVAAFVLKGAYSKSGFLTLGAWLILWPILRKNVTTILGITAGAILVALYYSEDLMNSIGFVFTNEIAALNGQVGVEHAFEGRWFIWADMWNEWQALGPAEHFLGAGFLATGAHNDYFQVLMHGGLVGLAIYLTMLVAVAWNIAKALARKADVFAIVALMLFVMWIIDTMGLVVSAFSGYQWFVWGIIGYCLHRFRTEGPSTEDSPAVPHRPPRFPNLLGAS